MKVEIKRDGLTLRGILHKPKNKEKFDLIILFEGLRGDHTHATSAGITRVVDQAGFATLNVDFESRGESDGKFSDMTLWGQLLDAYAIFEYARKISGVQKIYVEGHSSGGLVAALLAGYYHDEIDGLILVSAALTAKDDVNSGQMFGIKYDPNHIPDYINLPTSNKVSKIQYKEKFAFNGFYARQLQSLPMYQIARYFSGPALIIHAEKDEEVDRRASYWFRGLYHDSSLHFIKGATHGYKEPGAAQKVGNLVVKFMRKHEAD